MPKFGKKHLGDPTDDDIDKLLKEIAELALIDTEPNIRSLSQALSLDDVA